MERRGEEDEADGEGEGGGDEEVSRVESGDAHHPQGMLKGATRPRPRSGQRVTAAQSVF